MRFNEDLHEKMKRTVWMTGCKSWYLNPNGTNSDAVAGLHRHLLVEDPRRAQERLRARARPRVPEKAAA